MAMRSSLMNSSGNRGDYRESEERGELVRELVGMLLGLDGRGGEWVRRCDGVDRWVEYMRDYQNLSI